MTDVYLNNDHTLTVSDLETATNVPLTAATLTYQIVDVDDENVASASGTLAQSGTSNTYSTEVDKDIANLLTKGEEYFIRISGVQGGYDFEFNIPITSKRRGQS